MKFGKLVSRAGELLPDLKHLCLRYKELKKLLKAIKPGAPGVPHASVALRMGSVDDMTSTLVHAGANDYTTNSISSVRV